MHYTLHKFLAPVNIFVAIIILQIIIIVSWNHECAFQKTAFGIKRSKKCSYAESQPSLTFMYIFTNPSAR